MSPKKQPKNKAKAKAAAAAVPAADDAPAAADPGPGEVADVNRAHYAQLEIALQRIMEHPLFSNIMHEEPIGINQNAASHSAGHKARFSKVLAEIVCLF